PCPCHAGATRGRIARPQPLCADLKLLRARHRTTVLVARDFSIRSRASSRVAPQSLRAHAVALKQLDSGQLKFLKRLGGHPKCTTHGRFKVYQGSVATFGLESVPALR